MAFVYDVETNRLNIFSSSSVGLAKEQLPHRYQCLKLCRSVEVLETIRYLCHYHYTHSWCHQHLTLPSKVVSKNITWKPMFDIFSAQRKWAFQCTQIACARINSHIAIAVCYLLWTIYDLEWCKRRLSQILVKIINYVPMKIDDKQCHSFKSS